MQEVTESMFEIASRACGEEVSDDEIEHRERDINSGSVLDT